MERQKIFWVVLSVSVFVVIVLVVGAFLLRPRADGTSAFAPGTVSPLSDQGTQVYEYQRETPFASSGTDGQGSGNTETQHFYIGEEPGASTAPGTSGASGASGAGTTGPAPGTSPAGAASPAPSGTSTEPSTSAARVATTPSASSGSRTAAAPPPRATPKPSTTTPRSTRVIEYWIQTGSYKSQTKAEDLASRLDGKGLSGRVFSYDSQGATWFRVRVGPYTNKGEADKFLAEVRKLQGLEASYVAQVGPVSRPVN